MTTTVLRADAVVLEHTVAAGAAVSVRDGVVVAIGEPLPAEREVRVEGTLLPGAIDLQVNGAGGCSVDELTPEALDTVARQVWHGGAVAFLPTLITAPFDELLEQLAALATWLGARDDDRDAAQALGIHLEGPFLSAAGAHDPEHFVDPTPARIDALLGAAGGRLALVTLSPERAGAAEATRRLRDAGVAVAMGHTTSAAGFASCVESGASLVTHLFNVMGAMHHRAPGLAGFAMDERRLFCSIVADGVHVHEVMVRNAWRCLGPDRTVLVTDSAGAAGMPDGDFSLGGRPVHLRDGTVRDDAGRLAGSALTMTQAAQRWSAMVPDAGVASLARVLATNPARVIGCSQLGCIAIGRRACFGSWHPVHGLSALRV